MAETLSRPSTERLDTPEKAVQDALERLNGIKDFVKENPDSKALPDLRAMLQGVLDERPAAVEADAPVQADDAAPGPEATDDASDIVPVSPETEKKPRLTFEQARREARPLSDDFILDALSGDLQKPGGERALMVKSYLDNVPADASDKEFASTNSEVIQLRDELADFVARELEIHGPPAYQSHLEDRKKSFIAKIEAGKQAFRDYVKGREERKSLSENRTPMAALEFYGMTVMTDGGNSVDLLESSVKDIYANLQIQRGVAGTFVRWSSNEYIEKKKRSGSPKLDRRIYLNPRPQDSVGVFSDVIHAAQDAGLTVKGKIYDRTGDSLVMKAYDSVGENYSVRGDCIVIATTDEDAEKLLAIAESVYDDHEAAFAGRGLSSIPFELAPGLGIGDEPTHEQVSLTSHRAGLIEAVLQKVRESGETDPAAQIRLFRRLWQAEADLENIRADNPAFNR